MISREVVVMNRTGIHARPAFDFVQAAMKFKSDITLIKDDLTGNGKSLVNILALCLNKDSKLTISAEGEDAEIAVDTLVKLVESKFGEE